MTDINRRILFIASYPPRQCGIATFTKNLADAIDNEAGRRITRVAALQASRDAYDYDSRVVHHVCNDDPSAYRRLADMINASSALGVSLQHEYGLYRGPFGDEVLDLLARCRKPVVTTLHTILPRPSVEQREILQEIARRSRRVVVMARTGVDLLEAVYGVPRHRVAFIPHGVPEVAFHHVPTVKARLGLGGRTVLMTFGLLSRGKGIEYMVEALPAIVERHPDALYVVLGKTHPEIKQREGESYRQELMARARALGVEGNLRFENRYVSDPELLLYLQAATVYVTPYVGSDQITSGTLAYAMVAGCATVSTKYLYAHELLGEGRGLLADFKDPDDLAAQIIHMLDHPTEREAMMCRAYEYGRAMGWRTVGQKYHHLFVEPVRPVTPTAELRLKRLDLPADRFGKGPANWRSIRGANPDA